MSFSGKDRRLARDIAREAKRIGLRIFYDQDQKAYMWGKSEQVYHDVYGRQSRTVVPIVSANYLDCEMSRFEYDIAKREANNRNQEYILPVRCDSSLLPGLISTTGYLSADEHNARQIAMLLKQKIIQLLACDDTANDESLQLQHADERLALGLLVTVAFPRQQEYFEQLFPDLKWLDLQDVLESKGLITVRDGIPDAGDAARKAIPKSSDEYRTLEKLWIETLEPIAQYMDIAPALALHYLGTDRIEDAVRLLAEVASSVDLGWWNPIYLSSLDTLASRKLSTFQVETKLAVLNSLGICFTHDRQYDAALDRYKSLERIARKNGCDYWVGQALINSGVALFHKGDRDGAVRKYRTAEDHGLKTRDWRLVGRVLGNLAESVRTTDLGNARELLRESVKFKRRAKDEDGLILTFMQQGNLEAEDGNPTGALEHYSKCEKACRKNGDLYLRSLSLHNLGKANAELGRQKTAVRYFKQAREIADEAGFDYPLMLSSLGLGVILFEQRSYAQSLEVFEGVLQDAKRLGDIENQICSIHAIAVSTCILEGPKAATPTFNKALRFAKRHSLGHWYARVVADKSRKVQSGELTGASPTEIAKAARAREKAGDHELAFYLWHHWAGAFQSVESEDEAIEKAYASMGRLLNRLNAIESDHITSVFEYADWQWSRGRFSQSLNTLEIAENVARDNRLHLDQAIAADKRGVYLQYQNKPRRALACHKRAVKIARRSGLTNLLEILLNNLGEAHRQLEQWNDANSAYLEAEELAGKHDQESAISTAHNRGLVLQDRGDLASAETIFKQCKERAKRGGFPAEQTRAWEALANLSLMQGNETLSLQRYEKAMDVGKTNRITAELSRTALNYASLLRHIGRPKDSIRVLRPYSASNEFGHDAHLIWRTLGQALHDLGNTSKAIESLEIAVQLAQRIGDIHSLLISSSALAEALEDDGRYADASEVILDVVNLEKDPVLWVALMEQLLRVQLAGDDEMSEQTYDRATKFATRRNLYSAMAELHMTVGLHYWTKGPDSKQKALQAFSVASAYALTQDTDCIEASEALGDAESLAGEVLGRTLICLTDPATATSQDELESFSQDLSSWAKSNIKNHDIVDFMTSPVRMAIKLLPLNRTPRKLAKMLDKLIADEFGNVE